MLRKAEFDLGTVYWVKVDGGKYQRYSKETLKPIGKPKLFGSIMAHTGGSIIDYRCDVDFDEPIEDKVE